MFYSGDDGSSLISTWTPRTAGRRSTAATPETSMIRARTTRVMPGTPPHHPPLTLTGRASTQTHSGTSTTATQTHHVSGAITDL